ncbi:MAG: HAD-IA family hydrolase [Myxococcales bacterium]
MPPRLFTFDVFGTIVDWRSGLRKALASRLLPDTQFDRLIDVQGEIEQGPFRRYAEIVAESLVRVLGISPSDAERIGADAGKWPLFPDSAAALARLRRIAPCAATTNSDRAHGEDVQRALGFRLDGWVCAEDVQAYKPDPRIWQAAAERLHVAPGRGWWHVSAYADYDLRTATGLGLTRVFVERPHRRPGEADHVVPDLAALADLVEGD